MLLKDKGQIIKNGSEAKKYQFSYIEQLIRERTEEQNRAVITSNIKNDQELYHNVVNLMSMANKTSHSLSRFILYKDTLIDKDIFSFNAELSNAIQTMKICQKIIMEKYNYFNNLFSNIGYYSAPSKIQHINYDELKSIKNEFQYNLLIKKIQLNFDLLIAQIDRFSKIIVTKEIIDLNKK